MSGKQKINFKNCVTVCLTAESVVNAWSHKKNYYNAKKNNSDLTPRGYDSYNLYKDENTEINHLVKRTFWDKYFYKILVLVFVIGILLKNCEFKNE